MEETYLYEAIIILGIAYIFAYLGNPDVDTFNGWMNVLTHVAAVPALFVESKMRTQIGITTVVSIIYHTVGALAKDSEFFYPLEQLDVGMSVALIAHMLFIYMDNIPWAPITFLAVSAAAFPDYNVAITGAIILFGYPVSTIMTYNVDRPLLTKIKWILVFLQVASIVAYMMADTWTTYTLHPIWHVASLLSIYYLIRLHQTILIHIVDIKPIPIIHTLRFHD
tara:strand:- start:6021 stop:6689 length:669 start_codon:yes stop_codon:yes gene_type:complete